MDFLLDRSRTEKYVPIMKTTKKAFRAYLNRTCAGIKHAHGRFAQRTRGYGDYLYAQDRDRFNVDFAAWIASLA